MTTPPKDTTERDELAKAIYVQMVRDGWQGNTKLQYALSESLILANAYMAEKERRDG